MSEPTYQEAFEELQQIVTEMEEGQISVDELTKKVARAASLISICKTKLNAAEHDVQEILSAIDSQEIMDSSTTSQADGSSAQAAETDDVDESPEDQTDDPEE